MNTQQQVQHLAWRAGFGLSLAEQGSHMPSVANYTRQLLKDNPYKPLTSLSLNDHLALNLGTEKGMEKNELRKQQYVRFFTEWLQRITSGQAPLRERMTYFWHDHFASQVGQPYLMQQQNNLLRKYALESFKDLLLGVAQDPVMLAYLNNRQNKKEAPNENFAREVMELFTLGRGNYTEADVKEAARAFTGWNFNGQTGEFKLNLRQHDTGTKTVLGRTGNLGGEDVVAILLAQPQCAKFIATKLYKYFVNEQPDDAHIASLAKVFYDSGYDIGKLMEAMLTADWFVDAANTGNRIKSPLELLVGFMRSFQLNFEDAQVPFFILKLLNENLFNPPNVAGWPMGKEWIDASSLMLRLRLGEVLLRAMPIELQAKDDGNDDDRMRTAAVTPEQRERQQQLAVFKKVQVKADFAPFASRYASFTTAPPLVDALAEDLLAVPLRPAVRSVVLQRVAAVPPERLLLELTIQLISLPEYQLT